MRRLLTILVFTVFLTEPGFCQKEPDSGEYYSYLKQNGLCREAITWLDTYGLAGDSFAIQVPYEKATLFLTMGLIDSAHFYFTQSDLTNDTAIVFAAIGLAFIVKDTTALTTYITKFPFSLDDSDIALCYSVITRKEGMKDSVQSRSDIFSPMDGALWNSQNRSAWFAGMLSAIIPGMGKGYAGNWHQARTTFTTNLVLGLVLAESVMLPSMLLITGINLAVSSVFYVGNVWGSSALVMKNRNDFYKQINENIADYYRAKLRY